MLTAVQSFYVCLMKCLNCSYSNDIFIVKSTLLLKQLLHIRVNRKQWQIGSSRTWKRNKCKTTFIVWRWGLPSLSTIKIFNLFLEVTSEIATYSCPCQKTGLSRNKPTSESNWSPWLLLIVIANATTIGSCLLISNGNFFI